MDFVFSEGHTGEFTPPRSPRMSFLSKRTEGKNNAPPREIEVVARTPVGDYTPSPRPTRKEGGVSVEDLLKSAAIMGDQQMLDRLLQEGLSVNCNDEIGNSPLHHCCEHGHVTLVRRLLEYEADVSATNQSYLTPLHVAAVNGHCEIATLLLKHNAPLDHTDVGGMTGAPPTLPLPLFLLLLLSVLGTDRGG